ncbi:DUF6809 family protein [Intestinimonas butyriciproducens]|uniref:DUF6809 family protein n=1 Tax=Intestinimonas butyriciproducens TaxID=1297617 RepID=UPI002432274B|nr:DUF6809 family protein [Intestinimonas butyriciproducens]MCI6363151.1 hypothetical protein [Intestinimonas butyriciproducens]MDY3615128.1 hypothetical protein [Intestinimonas butyriciproducens]
MPATLRDLFYCRYNPMEAAAPDRPEYDAIYEELEQVEDELRKALGEEGREKLRRFSVLEAQLRNMSYGDYFAEGFHLALSLLRNGPYSPPA